MYKILFTDLDDTILNDQKHVSKADIETITKLTDTKIIVATGRSFGAIQGILDEIGLENKPNQYTITYNGGMIYENNNLTPIFSEYLSFDEVKTIFEIGRNYDVCIQLCTDTIRYFYSPKDDDIKNIRISNIEYKTIDDNIDFLKNENVAKVVFSKSDMPYLKHIKEEIKQDDNFAISFSTKRFMEINPLSISKGGALTWLCKHLNVDIKDTIAVGDSYNDVSMIKTAGLGIGVKNSSKDIIPYCDVILENTNNENPITEIFNRFIKKV